ncbi:MAG TPA: FtsQ-type POTRA domain-containing protein, partial [Sphingomicrobium sp.]|nr:FtsQ-type POTRA domain-containing protein [Sphingomicrobium sp.]
MSAAHVRRGGPARAKPRKPAPKRAAGKRGQARANRLAGLAFAAFLLAIGVVVVIALDIPSKAATSAGAAVGRAGFTVKGYQIVGLNRMNRALVDAVIVDELRQASDSAGGSKPAQPLVDVADIRDRLLRFGWVKDARVSRRLP